MGAGKSTTGRSFAAILAAVYGGFGAAWIAVSDTLLEAVVSDPHRLTAIQTGKGWAFVALSALLIYGVGARLSRGIRDTENRYRMLFADSPEALVVYDPDTLRLVEINAAAGRLFGYEPAEAADMPVTDLMPRETRLQFERFTRRLAGGQSGDGVWRLRCKDGRPLDVSTQGQSVTISGRRVRLVQIVDVTARLRAERELLRAVEEQAATNARMRDLAHALSHDLQEPLRQVSSFVQLLAKRYHDQLDPEAHQFISFAVEGIVRLKTLITDAERFALTTAFVSTRINLDHLVADVVEGLQTQVEAAGAVIQVGLLPEVEGDPGKLAVVFHALMDNALKFRSPARPAQIRIEAERQERRWLVRIADNGIGIEPEFREAVFTLFSRLHTRDRIPGNGTGLALARKLVEAHGGRIWVEDGEAGGAALCFTMPEEEWAGACAPAETPGEAAGEMPARH
ncbi:MAG TPA: ATP-binding protein [Magnetospirillum sp.]|nr:ATP-binding protein [Magnetospirillum sp.]